MRVVIPLANGVEETEAITIIDVLRRGGIDVTSVSMDESGLDVEGAHQIGLVADACWEDGEVESADMIVLPGGMGGMLALKADPRVLATLQRFNKAGKFIGALCAAPVVLQEAGILKGRKAVCYPGMEASLPDATFVSGCNVMRDGNVITGTGPATAMEFALAILEMLKGSECKNEIAKGLLFH